MCCLFPLTVSALKLKREERKEGREKNKDYEGQTSRMGSGDAKRAKRLKYKSRKRQA